jgi:3-deoxy-D-manno-octulosonic acid (KDO) 8-phosphate synthase
VFPQVRGSLQSIPFEAHAGFTSLEYTRQAGGDFIFKASFDKANPPIAAPACTRACAFWRASKPRASPLARAAVAAGVNGVFIEVHDAHEKALSDGANALRLSLLSGFWEKLKAIHAVVA